MRTAFAIARRDLARWFTSPTGYVFITLFVLMTSAAQFWNPRFFQNNLANLAPLNDWFPYLLLFFVPAVAMSAWADERRHGTDELLLTLPTGDFEIVLGKYLAALGIYSVALLFAFSNVLILSWLGRPDVGLMLSTYAGYFLLGAALLAVAMIGSSMTDSVPVAFVLGAVFCLVPVLIGDSAGLARDAVEPPSKVLIALRATSLSVLVLALIYEVAFGFVKGKRQQPALVIGLLVAALLQLLSLAYLLFDLRPFHILAAGGVRRFFADLTAGIFSIGAVVYFLSVTVVGIAINYFLLRRRRLTTGMWHLPVRAASLVAIAAAFSVIVARTDARVDMTAERLHSLSDTTIDAIQSVAKERPVFIQAFVSPEVPKDYVQQRETLLALLREYDSRGGDRIIVNIRETKRASDAAREARDKYGVKPYEARAQGRRKEEIYLGVVVTCGTEEVVVPFLYPGVSAEYELTRAIRTALKKERVKVGILSTEAKWTGGFSMEFGQFNQAPEWQVVTELKRQYEVVSVAVPVDAPITEKVDVLVVPMVSSLSQPALDNLLAYLRQGRPALLLDDPMPWFNQGVGPNESPRGSPFGGPPPSRGDFRAFYGELGILWNPDEIVWDTFNPHPTLYGLPREIVFVGKDNGAADAINPRETITSGLQEVAVLAGGRFRTAGRQGITVTPLLKAGSEYGIAGYLDIRTRSARYEPLAFPNKHDYALAARVSGTAPAAKPGDPDATLNVVFIADVDLISDQFFQIQRDAIEGLNFDNTTLVLNSVDALAGDNAMVALRKRRPKHRTLDRFERETRVHERRMLTDVQKAEDDAKKAIEEAKKALTDKVAAIRARTDLDDMTKEIMLDNVEDVENARLRVAQTNIEDEKGRKIERSENERDQAIDDIQFQIRGWAILIPFIPPFSIGIVVLIARLLRELRESR